MAGAEQLLNEAQYAFQSISSGQSPDNKRNASRASSLCKKIIRKFPTSSYAAEAHAILRRLGEEAYSSHLGVEHRHTTQAKHHTAPTPMPKSKSKPLVSSTRYDEMVPFDWAALMAVILVTSKKILAVIAFFVLFLFSIFGPFMFLMFTGLMFLTRPIRQLMKPQERQKMNEFVVRANAYIEERRKSGTGLT
ncbi:MAG: hypothetical protein GQ577_04885 [Woeseiaceae bacterium]|nr:hypothetical protein [Woeseiaceae bacterium]